MKRVMGLLIGAVAPLALAQAQDIPSDLHLLVGKHVIVGRMPLCEPNTYIANLAYAGKAASVTAFRPNASAAMPANILAKMGPQVQQMMVDNRNGGTLTFQFEDGKVLDTCVDQGFKQLTDNLALAPGEVLNAPAIAVTPAAAPTASSATPARSQPQDCPILFTKVSSGSGGVVHALIDAMTTSDFQLQLDETEHGGAKHYLDIKVRNASAKPIAAFESVVVYSNKMGDETVRDTLVSQNSKPIQPGEELRNYAMDREAANQNGAGDIRLYVARIRYTDQSIWQDNGSQSCASTAVAR